MKARTRIISIWVLFVYSVCTFGCVADVVDQPDDKDEISKLMLPIKDGIAEYGTHWGVLRLGSDNHLADGSDTSWKWFCSGVLIQNNIAVTAKHCIDGSQISSTAGKPMRNFIADPSELYVYMKSESGEYPFRLATQIVPLQNSDIAGVAVNVPFAMWNSNRSALTYSGYSRPFDYRFSEEMDGSYMACLGMGGSSYDNPYTGEITFDIFTASDLGGLRFSIPLEGYVGGKPAHGDSGGPCLDVMSGATVDMMPLSGIMASLYTRYESVYAFYESYLAQ